MQSRRDALWLSLAKAATTAAVLWSGFTAVSDDDYARLVIAQKFAASPSLDPSGSSWLPLPFYVYGSAFALFGRSLWVAQALAALLGLASIWLLWRSALLLGSSARAAFAGALLAALLPHSAYLGAACVPEAPTAALVVFAAASLKSPLGSRTRLLGAACLFAACASRYEPWAAAAVFGAIGVFDALRAPAKSRLTAALPAALSAAFPVLWLLHGSFRHHDATFFVSRVTAYRAALGPDGDFWERLVRTPQALFTGEPELMLVFTLLALPLLWRTRRESPVGAALLRFGGALGAIVLFSLVGDLRGSAPTHHAGRALLAPWLGAALLTALAGERAAATQPKRRGLLLGLAATLLMGVALRRATNPEPFVDRRSAVAIGQRARLLGVERLAIDSSDFAFFAVQAGFGRPEASVVLCDHDPRRPCAVDWLFHEPQQQLERLRSRGFQWLALPNERSHALPAMSVTEQRNPGWTLRRLASERAGSR